MGFGNSSSKRERERERERKCPAGEGENCVTARRGGQRLLWGSVRDALG